MTENMEAQNLYDSKSNMSDDEKLNPNTIHQL
jgi:hypothetical protein